MRTLNSMLGRISDLVMAYGDTRNNGTSPDVVLEAFEQAMDQVRLLGYTACAVHCYHNPQPVSPVICGTPINLSDDPGEWGRNTSSSKSPKVVFKVYDNITPPLYPFENFFPSWDKAQEFKIDTERRFAHYGVKLGIKEVEVDDWSWT